MAYVLGWAVSWSIAGSVRVLRNCKINEHIRETNTSFTSFVEAVKCFVYLELLLNFPNAHYDENQETVF